MKPIYLSSILFTAASFCVPLFAANPIPADPDLRIGTLPNGLTYYIRHNNTPSDQVDFFLAQKVGSVNEEENQRGLAHFLEHMCFNGTRHFPGNSLISYLESVGVKFGANLNAYTSTDQTVYNICQVPSTRISTLDSCLLILRDWSGDLLLDKKEIDAERGVIKGEWRQRNSQANNRLLEKAAPEIFNGSIYGERLPIGKMEIVENFKPKELKEYYKKWYHPSNQCVIVVGDVDVDHVEAQIKNLWKDVRRKKGEADATLFEVPENENAIATVQSDPEQNVSMVQVWIKHNSGSDEDALTIEGLRRSMAMDLAVSMICERFDILEEKPGCPFFNMGIGDRKFLLTRGQDALMVRANARPGHEEEVVSLIAGELKRAASQGFLQTELDRAKVDARSKLENAFANRSKISNTDYARKYVDNFLNGGSIPSEEAYYKMMKGVIGQLSLEDIDRYFREIVPEVGRNTVIICYLPEKGVKPSSGDLAKAWSTVDGSSLPLFTDVVATGDLTIDLPKPGTIVSEVSLPELGTSLWTLSNGVKVHLRHSSEVPDQIFIKGYSPGGFSVNFDSSEGPDYKMANDALAVSATGPYSASTLKKLLVGKNAKASLAIENVEETVEASTNPTDLETAFKLIYLKSTDMRMDSVAFGNMMEARRAKLESSGSNATTAMGDSIHRFVYRDHPFGSKINAENISLVDYGKIFDIYRDRFSDMSDFTFYVTGNFDTDSLRNYACRYLATLPAGSRVESGKDTGYGYSEGRSRHDFHFPMETPQTIAYTFYNSPGEYNLRNVLLGQIVGNVVKEKLMAELREKRGWTYGIKSHVGVSAGMNGGSDASIIMPVYIRVAPEHTDETFDFVARTVDSLPDRDFITPAEMEKAKRYMAKNYLEAVKDNGYWLTVMHMYDRFGEDMNSNYNAILESITLEDLKEFSRKYLKDANRIQLSMNPE